MRGPHLPSVAWLLPLLLAACAATPPAPAPLREVPRQILLRDGATGAPLLVAADSAPARQLAATHPGQLLPASAPDSSHVTLGNVSIPLRFGQRAAPAVLPSAPFQESVP